MGAAQLGGCTRLLGNDVPDPLVLVPPLGPGLEVDVDVLLAVVVVLLPLVLAVVFDDPDDEVVPVPVTAVPDAVPADPDPCDPYAEVARVRDKA